MRCLDTHLCLCPIPQLSMKWKLIAWRFVATMAAIALTGAIVMLGYTHGIGWIFIPLVIFGLLVIALIGFTYREL